VSGWQAEIPPALIVQGISSKYNTPYLRGINGYFYPFLNMPGNTPEIDWSKNDQFPGSGPGAKYPLIQAIKG